MYCVICGYINKPKPTSKEALPVPPVPPQQSRADDGDDGLEDLIDDDAIESYNRSRMSALSATSKRKRSAPVVKTVDGSNAERVLRQVGLLHSPSVILIINFFFLLVEIELGCIPDGKV